MISLLCVPVAKQLFHVPPVIGIFFGLAIIWIITELIHLFNKESNHHRVSSVLSRIDLNSLLFFVGILLAVNCLQSMNILNQFAEVLDHFLPNKGVMISVLGLFSSVIDNVPLVAATMGMYPLAIYPTDHSIWEMIALCAGTGGSILIIGSAAGVVVMGMEKISFGWYLKRISFTALLGYVAAVATYLTVLMLIH
mgnify:CR=1 FL=1